MAEEYTVNFNLVQDAARTAGVQVSIAALLKNSQIFTNSLGALFQIIGGFIDVALAPLMPLIAAGLSSLANQLPVVARIAEATLPRLVGLFQGIRKCVQTSYKFI